MTQDAPRRSDDYAVIERIRATIDAFWDSRPLRDIIQEVRAEERRVARAELAEEIIALGGHLSETGSASGDVSISLAELRAMACADVKEGGE